MATNFPTSADDAATVGGDSKPAAGTALSDSTAGHPSHSDLHENVGDAVQAVEAKVGTGSSAPAANTVLTGTGSGTSGWATVSTAMIADDAVTAAKLASNAVVTASIVDDNVTQAKIADDAVGADQLAASAVVTASIVDDNVTQAKIAAGAVGTTELGADAVDGTKIADNAINSEHYVDGSIDPEHLADNAVTAAKLANDAVDASHLQGNTLASGVTASSLTSVGSLTGLDVNGLVKVNDGSAAAPTFTFDSDEGNGMYLHGTDTIGFTTGGSLIASLSNNVNAHGTDASFTAADPIEGTGDDAEWHLSFLTYYLRRNSSLAASKENITDDLGTHLTANMIDSVVPKMWNRKAHPGYPEIGPLADDMDAISPFLVNRGTDAEGDPVLTGVNKTAYLSLLVLAVKDLRTQVADLTTRLEALEG